MARRSTNAFGEPWQGSKIIGAGSLARARGYAYGALTSQQRGEFGSQANFQAAAEQAAQREERLKKKGRDEVMTRDPDDEEITQEGREEALKELEAQWGALVNGSLSETALKELEAQQEAQAKADKSAADEAKRQQNNAAPKPRAPGSLKLLGDTSPAALAKIRRAINRREQRPSYTPSGQVIRGGW